MRRGVLSVVDGTLSIIGRGRHSLVDRVHRGTQGVEEVRLEAAAEVGADL
jgi:hypothetical protein